MGRDDFGELTLAEAREELELYVRTTWWLRRGLAARLPIEELKSSGAYHVILESFTEGRVVVDDHEPYHGGPVDGPENGRPPGPWDMEIDLPGLFLDDESSYVVPHTAEVRSCHSCGGDGRVSCSRCGGDGKVRCSRCGGSGRISRTRTVSDGTDSQGFSRTRTEHYTESCSCFMGKVRCSNCGGDGRVKCHSCRGSGELEHFQRLDVTWSNHVDTHVIEGTDLPDEMIEEVDGILALEEEEEKLEPSLGHDGGPFRGGRLRVNKDVDEASNQLLADHHFGGGLVLHRQRLTVRAVPVYEASYPWGKEARRFWIYGTDRVVHAPRYPLSWLRIALASALGSGITGGIITLVVNSQ